MGPSCSGTVLLVVVRLPGFLHARVVRRLLVRRLAAIEAREQVAVPRARALLVARRVLVGHGVLVATHVRAAEALDDPVLTGLQVVLRQRVSVRALDLRDLVALHLGRDAEAEV